MIIKTSVLSHGGNEGSKDGIFVDVICDLCDKQIALRALPNNELWKFGEFKTATIRLEPEIQHYYTVDEIEKKVNHLGKMLNVLLEKVDNIYYYMDTVNYVIKLHQMVVINDKHICKDCWDKYHKAGFIPAAKDILKDINTTNGH